MDSFHVQSHKARDKPSVSQKNFMPCKIKSVDARFNELVHVIQLRDFMDDEAIDTLVDDAIHMQWNKSVPGGFIHNTPQRLVNSFGDGSGYNAINSRIGDSTSSGYWTAAVHQSDCTLVTDVEPLPDWLQKFGLQARSVASKQYNIIMNDYSFNLAVCNFYTKSQHEIAAHTDDNDWYTKDLPDGPMFASLTLYPSKKPASPSDYARFELYIDGEWIHKALPHASLLLMPSCIPHRVRPASKDMCQRINITLRSVPSMEDDPYNCIRGVSNHARYYRLPRHLIFPKDKCTDGHVDNIITAFNTCLHAHKRASLKVTLSQTKAIRKKQRAETTMKIKKYIPSLRLQGNVVNELLYMTLAAFSRDEPRQSLPLIT